MNWLELKLIIPTEFTEQAENFANMTVPYGFYLEDYSDIEQGAREIAHIDLIDEELLGKDRTHSIIHIYISNEDDFEAAVTYLSARLEAIGVPHEIDTASVSDEDWADNWKKFFKVTPVGERLVVRPSWEEFKNTEGKVVVSMDPGAAFGTGTHATTRMCLKLIEKYVKQGDGFLDVGCGSGILSIAAALLGAKRADGVDIDPVAVKVAKENAELNLVSDRTEYTVGDLAEKIKEKYDVVCANIVADIIIRLSDNVNEYMKDDAVFICSGIIDIRSQEVERALEQNGFEMIEAVSEENWRAYAAKLKK